MKMYMYSIVSIALVVSLSGCQTTGWEQQQRQDERLASEISELRVSMQRMEHRLSDLIGEQDDLGADLLSLRDALREQSSRSDSSFSALSSRLDEQEARQRALRQELTEDLSRRMEEVIRTQVRAASASQRPRGSRAEVGYEHEVQSGETLSEIARAYGVTSQDIMQANDLRNPDVLRVGQTLFIPAR